MTETPTADPDAFDPMHEYRGVPYGFYQPPRDGCPCIINAIRAAAQDAIMFRRKMKVPRELKRHMRLVIKEPKPTAIDPLGQVGTVCWQYLQIPEEDGR